MLIHKIQKFFVPKDLNGLFFNAGLVLLGTMVLIYALNKADGESHRLGEIKFQVNAEKFIR
jgi:hypothetical protein